MASFFVDLWNSIFTPGPTPSIMLATNISFASLQIVLFGLLLATYSVHFIVLSFLCTALWWSINWFVRELEAATAKENTASQLRQMRRAKADTAAADAADATATGDTPGPGADADVDDSGTETEAAAEQEEGHSLEVESRGFLSPDTSGVGSGGAATGAGAGAGPGQLRKRLSIGEASSGGDLSTDSEWDKMEEVEGDVSGR